MLTCDVILLLLLSTFSQIAPTKGFLWGSEVCEILVKKVAKGEPYTKLAILLSQFAVFIEFRSVLCVGADISTGR